MDIEQNADQTVAQAVPAAARTTGVARA